MVGARQNRLGDRKICPLCHDVISCVDAGQVLMATDKALVPLQTTVYPASPRFHPIMLPLVDQCGLAGLNDCLASRTVPAADIRPLHDDYVDAADGHHWLI